MFLYAVWKIYSWFAIPEHRPLYVKIKDIDIYTGMREGQAEFISGRDVTDDQRHASIAEIKGEQKTGAKKWALSIVRSVF